ncbi:MAG: type II transport protein GspH [Gammaproteobacteria bacterium]|nr:type II transport protein GspH [Gammaproteobacteria bacterium]
MLSKQGFSLINLLVVTAIIAIAVFVAVPGLSAALKQTRVASEYNQVLTLVDTARQYALINRSYVTMCPSSDGEICSRDWMAGILVFVDRNNDQVLGADDLLIQYARHRSSQVKLTWRAFRRHHYLNFSSLGWTDHYNGTFRFCIEGDDLRFNRALIVSKTGRIRKSTDRNRDGVHEDASGRVLRC